MVKVSDKISKKISKIAIFIYLEDNSFINGIPEKALHERQQL
jgi:hypothetical protein